MTDRYVWCPTADSELHIDGESMGPGVYGRIWSLPGDGIPRVAQCCTAMLCSPPVEIIPMDIRESGWLVMLAAGIVMLWRLRQ
jgi:hypothetical protein